MAKKDIKNFSHSDIAALRARGATHKTPKNAPELELSDAFWQRAHIVETRPNRKTSVHLRLDPDTLAFYRDKGRGHLTRMAKILKAYADTQQDRV